VQILKKSFHHIYKAEYSTIKIHKILVIM